MKDIFTVEKAVVIKADGRESLCFFVLENGSPDFLVNNWLELKGAHSSLTARQYAYNLTRFLNYLKTIGKGYKNATKADVLNFMSILLYGGEDNVYNLKANITINTGLVCLNTIKEFYRYLEDYTNQSLQMRLENRERRSAKYAYLYGQIWDMDSKELLLTKMTQRKECNEYVRWYSTEEKNAILSNLQTRRDKAIFLMSLEGMRIDEILSLKIIKDTLI